MLLECHCGVLMFPKHFLIPFFSYLISMFCKTSQQTTTSIHLFNTIAVVDKVVSVSYGLPNDDINGNIDSERYFTIFWGEELVNGWIRFYFCTIRNQQFTINKSFIWKNIHKLLLLWIQWPSWKNKSSYEFYCTPRILLYSHSMFILDLHWSDIRSSLSKTKTKQSCRFYQDPQTLQLDTYGQWIWSISTYEN